VALRFEARQKFVAAFFIFARIVSRTLRDLCL
jgi:hypothetical protein